MTITASTVLQNVLALAAEQPNTQASCVYFNDDGTPCCIVGSALARAGLSAKPFLEDDDLNQWTDAYCLFAYHGDELGLASIDEDDEDGVAAMNRLKVIQGKQDSGSPWGEAAQFTE